MNWNPTIRIVPELLHSSLKPMFQWHNEVKKLLRVRFSLFWQNVEISMHGIHHGIAMLILVIAFFVLEKQQQQRGITFWYYGTDLSANHMTQFKTQCYKEKGYSWLYTMRIK